MTAYDERLEVLKFLRIFNNQTTCAAKEKEIFQHRRLNRFFIEAYLRLLRVLLSRCDTFHPQPAPLG